MIKTFISYHHRENQEEKNYLQGIINGQSDLWDKSVEMGDIPEYLTDQQIRTRIRDEYLRDTSVTVVICDRETPTRKHVDWEIHSSMYDGSINTKSGIVVVDMIGSRAWTHSEEVKLQYSCGWSSLTTTETRQMFSHLPNKIVDNLVKDGVTITVLPYWDIVQNPQRLFGAIRYAHNTRQNQDYDLSTPMRSRNSSIF